MIELKDLSYVRLGASSLEDAESFATKCLGLQIGEQSGKALYLRSDDRAHTLCYFEGDPADQTVGFEVEDESKLGCRRGNAGSAGPSRACRHADRMCVTQGEGVYRLQGPHRQSDRTGGPAGTQRQALLRSRDAGITGFSHVGLYTTDPTRDEQFWTQVCNARVSDRIGDIALMRVNAIHHTIALAPGPRAGNSSRQPSGREQRRCAALLLSSVGPAGADRVRPRPASDLGRALPVFQGTGWHGVRIFRRRRRDRGRGHAPAAAIRLRAEQSVHVGLQVCRHAPAEILKTTIIQTIRR